MADTSRRQEVSRRGFLTAAAAAGAGALVGRVPSVLADDDAAASTEEKKVPQVARRPFGKTGMDVSILSLGGMFDTINGHALLRQALKYGVNYWDTAKVYGGGSSEKGMGSFLVDHPELRKSIFLVTKSPSRDPKALTLDLNSSLERLQTDHVELFFIHAVNEPDQLTAAQIAWADKMKKAGKIKLFGFSSHDNMSACLRKAVALGGIDGIMISWNFRLMVLDEKVEHKLSKAIDACLKAGIGMTAMKTQGRGVQAGDPDAEQALLDAFTDSGYTPEQAALKAVWKDGRCAAICSQMPNMTIFRANLAAALDKTELTDDETAALRRYALATSASYCGGCSNICRTAVDGQTPVCDVMRYLMYHNSYGDRYEARQLFAALPADVRRRLASQNYSAAEARCPQGMAIGRRMRDAADLLA